MSYYQFESESGADFTKITPGIRFQNEINSNLTGDQSRIMSPQNAFKNGADFLVMGRSILQSKNIDRRINELIEI